MGKEEQSGRREAYTEKPLNKGHVVDNINFYKITSDYKKVFPL